MMSNARKVLEIVDLIREDLDQPTRRSNALPPYLQNSILFNTKINTKISLANLICWQNFRELCRTGSRFKTKQRSDYYRLPAIKLLLASGCCILFCQQPVAIRLEQPDYRLLLTVGCSLAIYGPRKKSVELQTPCM
uniref:Uncharacterized protein n=1 Tax=Romanomermis culicivorax TaxID=13658 RepID=A0A915IFU5_ROMCU